MQQWAQPLLQAGRKSSGSRQSAQAAFQRHRAGNQTLRSAIRTQARETCASLENTLEVEKILVSATQRLKEKRKKSLKLPRKSREMCAFPEKGTHPISRPPNFLPLREAQREPFVSPNPMVTPERRCPLRTGWPVCAHPRLCHSLC